MKQLINVDISNNLKKKKKKNQKIDVRLVIVEQN